MKEEDFKVGLKINTKTNGYIKIMAISEGWIMARRKGCIPFCKSIKEFSAMVKEEIITPTNRTTMKEEESITKDVFFAVKWLYKSGHLLEAIFFLIVAFIPLAAICFIFWLINRI